MLQNVRHILVITILLPLLSGCWDRIELNELAAATGMAIDKKDGIYHLSMQFVNAGETSFFTASSGASTINVYTGIGKTVYEAFRDVSVSNSRRAYVSHLRILVLSEKVAKEGLADVLDFISRDNFFRSDFLVMVAKDTAAKDTLKILTTMERIPANKIYGSLKTSEKIWASTEAIELEDLLDRLTSEGRDPVLSTISIKGDVSIGETKKNTETSVPGAILISSHLAVFRKDQLVGWLSKEDGKGYNFVVNRISNSVDHISCPTDGLMAFEVIHSQTKIRANKELIPQMSINLKVDANIGDAQCQWDLTNPKMIPELEERIEKRITEIINKSVEVALKEHKADIFGFGQVIHRSNPDRWKQLKKDWNKHLPDLEVKTNVEVKIREIGTIGNPLQTDIKE